MGAIMTCPLEVIKTRLQSSATQCRRSSTRVRPGGSSGVTGSCSASSVGQHMHYYTPEMNLNLYYHHQQCPINTRLVVFHESVLPASWTGNSVTSSPALPKGTLSCFR